MAVGTAYLGNLSDAEKVAFYNSTVEKGFQEPFDSPQELCYTNFTSVKGPKDLGIADGRTVEKVSFGFSPNNVQIEDMEDGRTGSYPLIQNSIECGVRPRGVKVHVRVEDFDKDLLGILDRAPKNFRRAVAKSPDLLIAKLMRNGKTAPVWYYNQFAKNFWDTGHKSDPTGIRSDTYDNLYTGLDLTEENLAQVVSSMHSIKGPDGLNLGVRPDTLIVSPSREREAFIACKAATIVYSNGTNPAPGQAANTAAHGENVHATLLKWIKKIIVFPELQDGQAINNTSWYLADTRRGGWGFVYAHTMPARLVSLMDPRDPNVFNEDRYVWGLKLREGANYALPNWVARVEE